MAQPYTSGFDAHTHLADPRFDADRQAVVDRARQAGVERWMVVGTGPADWSAVTEVAQQTGGHALLGIHPWVAATLNASALSDAMDRLSAGLTRFGLGETGLDKLQGADDLGWGRQLAALDAQLDLAKQRNLPLTLHCVRATGPLLAALDRVGVPDAGGLVHAWMGPPGAMQEFLRRGLHISIGPGLFTGKRVVDSAIACPQDRLLLETDCPDWPLDGRPMGEPADLVAVATRLAALRGGTVQQWLSQTATNGARLFRTSTARTG